MARPGISYSEVSEAAQQLVGQGRNPTVEQVRLLLGTGSSTTIANHLRQWKAHQSQTNLISVKENIPSEFVSLMKGLWERVVNHSEERITTAESAYQQVIADLQQELEKYKTNNQRWQKMYEQWITEKAHMTSEKVMLEQALSSSNKENTALVAKQEGLQDRIAELHRLHQQIQTNLEHYRESMREQRQLDQQQFDNQKQQFQIEIKTLNETIVIQREKLSALQQQFQLLEQTSIALEQNYTATQVTLEQAVAKLESTEKAKAEYFHAAQHWEAQCKALQQTLHDQLEKLIDAQSESRSLSKQLNDTKQGLDDLQGQHKLLSHDKWMLSQEKAHLEGQLKQMQQMISV